MVTRLFAYVTLGASVIKIITAVIYVFHNKLEYLSLNTKLGWKGLPGTNTLAYYRNCKLRPNKFYDTGPREPLLKGKALSSWSAH